MFRLPGRKREAKETESRPLEESRGAGVAEDAGNGEQLRELVDNLVEPGGPSSSASVRSILKAAISSAEQIVDSVKTRVVEEAQQEAAKIIVEAKKEAEKIKGGKAPVSEEITEDIISLAEKVAEERMEEIAPLQEEAVAAEEAEEVQLQAEATEQAAEAMIPQNEEPASAETVVEEAVPDKAGEEKEAKKKAPEITATKEERESQYTGEVELTVEAPLEPTTVSNLYNYLQTTPEIKFVRTTGSWNKGTSITIAVDKPVSLISELASRLPGVDIVPERVGSDAQAVDRRRVRKINISLRDK